MMMPHSRMYLRLGWLSVVITFLLAGCATVPKDYPRTVTSAVPTYLDTRGGQMFEEAAAQHPGKSGFALIRDGRVAFVARAALTELAEKTLDLQYYIWEPDSTGRILANQLLEAADRGVRVRLLVDDINMAGRDADLAAIDAHPNIEIRLFNPFANRGARVLDFAIDLNRVNHRMHNKVMVMDNAVAIVGGRNIGNHYFGVATDANFRDLDIAAAGPIVRDVSDVFDDFWNGEWSVPIDALVERSYRQADLEQVRAVLDERIAEDPYPYSLEEDIGAFKSQLVSIRDRLIWAPGIIVWDDPNALAGGAAHGEIIKGLARKLDTLQDELLIESAYFVMKQAAVDKLQELEERGVSVRVLTNSLASNDVIAAHAGHAKRRKAVIEAGVDLYEYRPDSQINKSSVWMGESKAALHTKALVFDRESVFIGSFNLDPRSANINTEAGLYVESPELAAQVIDYMDAGVRPENSYHVRLDDDGALYWETQRDGAPVRYDVDPGSTGFQRFLAGFIMLLPVEDQL